MDIQILFVIPAVFRFCPCASEFDCIPFFFPRSYYRNLTISREVASNAFDYVYKLLHDSMMLRYFSPFSSVFAHFSQMPMRINAAMIAMIPIALSSYSESMSMMWLSQLSDSAMPPFLPMKIPMPTGENPSSSSANMRKASSTSWE